MSPVFAFLLLAAGALAADNTTKVSVTVYYESLCPDSMAFVTKQLYPTWEKMMDNINLTLVPYGKSSYTAVNETYNFTCHHGEEECFGNKIQACILDSQDIKWMHQVKLINCLMTEAKKSMPYPTKKCVQTISELEANVISEKLETCANSTHGNELLRKMGDKTTAFAAGGLSNVPTVAINDNKDAGAVDKFQDAVCAKFTSNKPETCKGKNGASSFAATLLPVVASLVLLKL